MFLGAIAIKAGPLDLTVVYPVNEQRLQPVDSTFIFGSVEPGSNVSINGSHAAVHKDGGWLAFVPVQPGRFEFVVRAQKNQKIDTATVVVNFPDPPHFSLDSLYFLPGSLEPALPLWVRPDDRIFVAFSGTPFCHAFCVVENTGDTIPMAELPPQDYYAGRSIFDAADSSRRATPDSLFILGIYKGVLTVPDCDGDELNLTYHLFPPPLQQIVQRVKSHPEIDLLPLQLHKLTSFAGICTESQPSGIIVLPDNPIQVVEFKDNLTTIRTGPGQGYLCIFQPAGIRAELAGREGPWVKLKLSDYQYGWVPDTAVIFLPTGSIAPGAYIRRIRTVGGRNSVSVNVDVSPTHAFQVIEDPEANVMMVRFFGVSSSTDWIRYDTADTMIDHIVWSQPEPGLYELKIHLAVERLWGYDASYVGNEFQLNIREAPSARRTLLGLRFVIDPGHSPDPGAVGPTGLTEKEANLRIALRLKKDLEREGAQVILTRSDSSALPLYDRPKIAVREQADMFISIHNNALPEGTNPFINNGISVYYYHPHSAALARAVHDALIDELDLPDFGRYYGNLAVSRPTQYPAILVECAFMTIPEQEALLKTDKFRKNISHAVIEGIKDFLESQP